MPKWNNLDLKQARKDFAQRIAELIGDKKNPETLQEFHKKTGRPVVKLISWRNPDHPNWPDIKSFLYICHGADVSPWSTLAQKMDGE